MQFLNPSAWLFAALFSVLIALYLWERYRRRVDVPSLILWETVPEAIVRTSRFRPDLLFFLQLLLLALLICGLADPYLVGRGTGMATARHIFVVDISASMQAREGRDTRFDQVRAAVRSRLGALPPSDEAMLITAASHPQVVTAFSRDHSALLAELAELHPVDTGTKLELALAIAHRAAQRTDLPTRIEVFTDISLAEIAPEWRERISVFNVGETDDNLAIDRLQVFQGRFQGYREARAHVAVRNFSHREAHGVLTLELEDQIFNRRGFSLAPRSTRSFPVGDIPGPGILSARLEVDDALAVDNHAYGWIRPSRVIRVLVVSEPSPLQAELARIGQATANLEFQFVGPEDYGADGGAADIVLFHRVAPDTPPEGATLYVFPATGNAAFAVGGLASQLEILDWNQDHPALRGLRPEVPFPLSSVQLVELPTWADALLSSRSGGSEVPLAFAGERAGKRTATIAFDLATDNLLSADHVNLLLFFLNLLDWLAPPDVSVTLLRTGDVEVVTDLPSNPRRVVDPRAQLSTFPANGPLAVEALYAGEYRIGANGTERRLFANFIDGGESDIGRPARAPFEAPTRSSAYRKRPLPGTRFGMWIYALAATLLVVEWFVAMRER